MENIGRVENELIEFDIERARKHISSLRSCPQIDVKTIIYTDNLIAYAELLLKERKEEEKLSCYRCRDYDLKHDTCHSVERADYKPLHSYCRYKKESLDVV